MSFTMASASPRAERWSDMAREGPSLPNNAKIVFQELLKAAKPLKAYALLELLQDQGISSPMTVYRALDRLVAEGLVRKIESLNAFSALGELSARTCIAFEVCQNCGKTRLIELSPSCIAELTALGIDPHRMYLESKMVCQQCDQPRD